MSYSDYATKIKELVTRRNGPLGWQEVIPAVTAMNLSQLAAYYEQLVAQK